MIRSMTPRARQARNGETVANIALEATDDGDTRLEISRKRGTDPVNSLNIYLDRVDLEHLAELITRRLSEGDH